MTTRGYAHPIHKSDIHTDDVYITRQMRPSMENDVALSKEAIVRLIKDRVSNYPDVDKLLSEGKLTYKSGWYEVSDKATFDAVSPYVTSLKSSKSGKAQVKLSKLTKKMREFAARH